MHWWPLRYIYAALDTQASTLNTALAGVLFQLQKAVQSTIKSNLGGWQSDTSLFENSTGNPMATLAELRGLIYNVMQHAYIHVQPHYALPGRLAGCRSPPDLDFFLSTMRE